MPRVREAYNKEHFDTNILKEMGELGFLGCTLEGDLGDGVELMGTSYTAYGLINREIERVDSGYRSALSVQSSLVMYPIAKYLQDEELKKRLLKNLATAESIGCFGLTEPNAGSDPAGMQTRMKDKGDHWLVSGSKTWITNSPHADVFVVWAKDDNGDIRGVVMEKGMKGLEAPKIEGKLSLRASTTGMIMMDEVKVPKKNTLDVKGLKGPFSCLNQARFGIAWGTTGAAEFCFHTAREYTMDRKQFGVPLASKQLVQLKLANMLQDINLGIAGIFNVSRCKDNGSVAPE